MLLKASDVSFSLFSFSLLNLVRAFFTIRDNEGTCYIKKSLRKKRKVFSRSNAHQVNLILNL